MGDFNLIKVDLGKTGEALVKRTADFVGYKLEPKYIEQKAKAEAIAKIIHTKADIEVDQLRQRALQRIGNEQIREQKNIEDIVCLALEHLAAEAQPEAINDDWMAFFFEKCKLVSNDQLKEVWGKILAGEANRTGSFSKRTLETVSLISQKEAESFSKLCPFVCNISGDLFPLVFSLRIANELYIRQQLTFGILMVLESAGLVHLNGGEGFVTTIVDGFSILNYFGEKYRLTKPRKMPVARPYIRPIENVFRKPNDKDINIDAGIVAFTPVGKELFKICQAKPIPEFLDFLAKVWATVLDFEKIEL